MNHLLKQLFGGICLLILLPSCTTYNLFQKPEEIKTDVIGELLASIQDPILKPGDRITISIWNHENISIGSINSVYTSGEGTGKWIMLDNSGQVSLPRIGRITLSGYNLKEASYFLEQKYETSGILNPIVNIKILNHYVTILGEVNAPGKYSIDNDKARIIEVLAEARGFTPAANTKALQLIRISNEQLQQVTVDLTNIESLVSKNYILRPDDIIYIPPKKSKVLGEFAQKATPIVGIFTSIAVIISVFTK